MPDKVAEIAVPRPLRRTFDYALPAELSDPPVGVRVRVRFGREVVVGTLVGKKADSNFGGQLQPVLACVDEDPVLPAQALALARWISKHYVCPLGIVLQAMVPKSLAPAKPSRHKLVELNVDFDRALAAIEALSSQAPQQAKLLASLLNLSQPTVDELLFQTGASHAPLRALVEKGWVALKPQPHAALATGFFETASDVEPTPDQQLAIGQIQQGLRQEEASVYLLQGVNGSGKTEVYLRAVEAAIAGGGLALVLVPEVSLTPQLVARFQHRLGQAVAVLHSGLTPAQRAREWTRLREGEARVLLGVRAASLIPLEGLRLIVIDEEHESTYKQDNSDPRYHARTVVLARGRAENAVVVLGSATPSLWTHHQAQQGALQRLTLPKRVIACDAPHVQVVDMSAQRGWLSPPLEAALEQTLKEGTQAMLLLNRRGFGVAFCKRKRHPQRCPSCDIALVFQLKSAQLHCNYCGFTPKTTTCTQCHSELDFVGLGTQRVEMGLKKRFPTIQIARMDSDSIKRGQHGTLLEGFRLGRIQVLLGTQMIALGHDFPNVQLMGIVNADTLLYVPDYRAAERTFQLISQAIGRVGRGGQAGRVVLQTRNPTHYAIARAAAQDYAGFAKDELAFRQALRYPPFGELCHVTLSHSDSGKAEDMAQRVHEALNRLPGVEAVGPARAMPFVWRGKARWQVWGKVEARSVIDSITACLDELDIWPHLSFDVEG